MPMDNHERLTSKSKPLNPNAQMLNRTETGKVSAKSSKNNPSNQTSTGSILKRELAQSSQQSSAMQSKPVPPSTQNKKDEHGTDRILNNGQTSDTSKKKQNAFIRDPHKEQEGRSDFSKPTNTNYSLPEQAKQKSVDPVKSSKPGEQSKRNQGCQQDRRISHSISQQSTCVTQKANIAKLQSVDIQPGRDSLDSTKQGKVEAPKEPSLPNDSTRSHPGKCATSTKSSQNNCIPSNQTITGAIPRGQIAQSSQQSLKSKLKFNATQNKPFSPSRQNKKGEHVTDRILNNEQTLETSQKKQSAFIRDQHKEQIEQSDFRKPTNVHSSLSEQSIPKSVDPVVSSKPNEQSKRDQACQKDRRISRTISQPSTCVSQKASSAKFGAIDAQPGRDSHDSTKQVNLEASGEPSTPTESTWSLPVGRPLKRAVSSCNPNVTQPLRRTVSSCSPKVKQYRPSVYEPKALHKQSDTEVQATEPKDYKPGQIGREIVSDMLLCTLADKLGNSWRWLIRIMGYSQSTLEQLEADYKDKGSLEMCLQSLYKWKNEKGAKATRFALSHYLRKINNNLLADELLKPEPFGVKDKNSKIYLISADSFQPVRKNLQNIYMNAKLNGLPWMKNIQITLKDYYVDLCIVKQNYKGRAEQQEEIRLEDIFKDSSEEPLIILVEGGPGYGKTTFASKLCYDHATDAEYIQKFGLVMMFPLRAFKGNLERMLLLATRSKELTNYEKKMFLTMLRGTSNDILLILDGFDELEKIYVDQIKSFIQRKEDFANLSLLVTSRPGHFVYEKENESPESLPEDVESRRCRHPEDVEFGKKVYGSERIQLMGINKTTQDFLDRYLKDFKDTKREEVKKEIAHIKNERLLAGEFLQCPLFLLMIIVLLTNDEMNNSPNLKTRTGLYKQIFNLVIKRYFTKKDLPVPSEFDLFSFSRTVEPLHVILLSQFGQVACEMLQKDKLSFSKEDIFPDDTKVERKRNTKLDPRIIELGLLTQSISIDGFYEEPVSVYEPVHKSLMEFAAAYKLWLTLQTYECNPPECDNEISSLRLEQSSLVYPFLSGLMEQKTGEYLQIIKRLSPRFYESWHDWLMSVC